MTGLGCPQAGKVGHCQIAQYMTPSPTGGSNVLIRSSKCIVMGSFCTRSCLHAPFSANFNLMLFLMGFGKPSIGNVNYARPPNTLLQIRPSLIWSTSMIHTVAVSPLYKVARSGSFSGQRTGIVSARSCSVPSTALQSLLYE